MTVAGDDDQAIYRFRGAAQKNLTDFEQEFPDATRVRLERSHRCGRADPQGGARGGRARAASASTSRSRAPRRRRCASGAAAPSARRRRPWPPRPSG